MNKWRYIADCIGIFRMWAVKDAGYDPNQPRSGDGKWTAGSSGNAEDPMVRRVRIQSETRNRLVSMLEKGADKKSVAKHITEFHAEHGDEALADLAGYSTHDEYTGKPKKLPPTNKLINLAVAKFDMDARNNIHREHWAKVVIGAKDKNAIEQRVQEYHNTYGDEGLRRFAKYNMGSASKLPQSADRVRAALVDHLDEKRKERLALDSASDRANEYLKNLGI
jgi:hypothetical protein